MNAGRDSAEERAGRIVTAAFSGLQDVVLASSVVFLRRYDAAR